MLGWVICQMEWMSPLIKGKWVGDTDINSFHFLQGHEPAQYVTTHKQGCSLKLQIVVHKNETGGPKAV